MAIVTPPTQTDWTVADLLDRFGPILLRRIRMENPAPGQAEEQDVVHLDVHENRLYELVDGVLVEKAGGYLESYIAVRLITILQTFVDPRRLGIVTGEGGMMRLAPGLVRIPDVAFVSLDHLPGRQIPRTPIPSLAPDLAVEVLSESNTRKEMGRKLHDYFNAGTRLVWYVDPVDHTVTVYTAPDRQTLLREDQVLDGGDVLPGFTLPLRDLFADPTAPPAAHQSPTAPSA